MASISTCFFTVTHCHKSRTTYFPRPSLQFHSLRSGSPFYVRGNSRFRFNKACVPLIRASIEVTPSAIRPGGIVESDNLPSDVRKRAMDAIDSCGGRVTIGDVSSKAGLELNEAQRALQTLAADTDGFLEVSGEGDVLYVFPKDYRSKLAAKSFRIKLDPLFEKAKVIFKNFRRRIRRYSHAMLVCVELLFQLAFEYLVRVSFGTALIASIVIVSSAIFALISSRSEEDNRGRRGRSYDTGLTFYLSPADLFWYWDPYYYRRDRIRKDTGDMNFIESVFSFVFGDGDPNQGIEEERWKLIGQYIASNGGVVAAEEIAPYLDVETTDNKDDDSYILPVLLRFDGQPEVDEEGNILYQFPSLQRTAASQRNLRKEYVGRKRTDRIGGLDKFFKEKKWSFSKTNFSERALAIGLGGLNLVGVLILGTMLNTMKVTPIGFIKFVSDIFPLLQIYAASFFTIPLIRWFFIERTNAEIDQRNRARQERARALESPDLSLRRKLLSARDMAQRTYISQDQIVYRTDKDLYEQEYEASEWDRRLREIEKKTD